MLWLREINSAMLTHTKTLMENQVDFYGTPINVKTLLRLPHMELVEEQYPCVSIYNTGYREDRHLSDPNSYVINQLENKLVQKKAKAPNFIFSYQIDIWCQSPLERDALTYKWVTSNPKYSILDIKDTNGDIHSCRFTQRQQQNMDAVNEDGNPIYRTTFNCEVLVSVEVTPKPVTYPVVTNVGVETKNNK